MPKVRPVSPSVTPRRSDRSRKASKRASSPYEMVRYEAPKKKPGPKPKNPAKQHKSPIKLVPMEPTVERREEEMPESELTGFLRDFKQPEPTAPKQPKKPATTAPTQPKQPRPQPNHASTSKSLSQQEREASKAAKQREDEDIQFIGVTPSAAPKPKAKRPYYNIMIAENLCVRVTNREIRFKNCTTEKPEVHIQSADFPGYDHVYTLNNQPILNVIRFCCPKETDRNVYAEFDLQTDGSFNIYEFGRHRNMCCHRSRGFESEVVRFYNNLLFVQVPISITCTLDGDQSHLVVHHPRGDFPFKASHDITDANDLNGVYYTAECGCLAGAILTESAVWVNYHHKETCLYREQTRVTWTFPSLAGRSHNHQENRVATVATTVNPNSVTYAQPSEEPVVVEPPSMMANLTLPSDLNNSRWLASFSRYHGLPVDGHIAHEYWNRVDISQSVAIFNPYICGLGPMDTSVLISHLLTGTEDNATSLELFFKTSFKKNFDILGTFENIDYRKQYRYRPVIESVVKFSGYCSALLEFVARYFEFRIFVIKNGCDFKRHGDWHGAPTPVATINCVKNGKYEIVMGMHGIYK